MSHNFLHNLLAPLKKLELIKYYWIEARGVGDGVSGDMLAPELAQSSCNYVIRDTQYLR